MYISIHCHIGKILVEFLQRKIMPHIYYMHNLINNSKSIMVSTQSNNLLTLPNTTRIYNLICSNFLNTQMIYDYDFFSQFRIYNPPKKMGTKHPVKQYVI